MPMIRALIRLTVEPESSEVEAGEDVAGCREEEDGDDWEDSAMVCFLTSEESRTALASCRVAWRTLSGYDRVGRHKNRFVIRFRAPVSTPSGQDPGP